MLSDKELELADQYIREELTDEEQASFEEKMNHNEELLAHVAMLKKITSGLGEIEQEERQSFDAKMKEWTKMDTTTNQVIPLWKRRKGLSAAAILLLMVGIGYFIMTLQQLAPEVQLMSTLYDKAYHMDDDFSLKRNTQELSEKEKQLMEGSELMNHQEYAAAQMYFENLLKTNSNCYQCHFNVLEAAFYNKQYDIVIRNANYIQSNFPNTEKTTIIHFYVAGSYFQQQEYEKAKSYFELVAQDKSDPLSNRVNNSNVIAFCASKLK